MKEKTPLFLLLFSIVFSSTAFVYTYTSSKKYEVLNHEIELTIEKKSDFLSTSQKEKTATDEKVAFENRRKEELMSELDTLLIHLKEAQNGLQTQQEKVKNLESEIKKAETIILNAKQAESEVLELQTQAMDQLASLVSQIPVLENKITDLNQEESDSRSRIRELEKKLANYQIITDQLRTHYTSSLKGIRQYARERPWIETGDVLTTILHSVDLVSGSIAFPLGAEEGIKSGMLFAIVSNQREIGRIRIGEVKRKMAVGAIIPLIGNPKELEGLGKIELVNL